MQNNELTTKRTMYIQETTTGPFLSTKISEFSTTMKFKGADTTNDNEFHNTNNLPQESTTQMYMNVTPKSENLDKNVNENITQNNELITNKTTDIQETTTDPLMDKLVVKSLNTEKTKTTLLYPVNPNYKPLKKIDVQQPKVFVRDPDDNSWRNESLSSMGIVFKPKNSSKTFTQVIKNKTESELNTLFERNSKHDKPDLKERLEKIAERRKMMRKKIDAYGNIIYSDYEEGNISGEGNLSKENNKDAEPAPKIEVITTTTSAPTTTKTAPITSTTEITSTSTTTEKIINFGEKMLKYSTKKPKEYFNIAEYYDTSDEEDADYLTLAKIDLKKFTVPLPKKSDTTMTTPAWPVTSTKPDRKTNTPQDNRQPTVQYFPPLTTEKVNINNYDENYQQKMNSHTITEPPINVVPVVYSKTAQKPKEKVKNYFTPNYSINDDNLTIKPVKYDNGVYMTPTSQLPTDTEGYNVLNNDGSFNKAPFAIKHYKDFLNVVANDQENERNIGYIPYTETPQKALPVTMNKEYEGNNEFNQHVGYENIPQRTYEKPLNDDYDYESEFRKEVLQRFVNNFNQNSERFKSDFPILYNNSVIHREDHSNLATSRTYLSRDYRPEKAPSIRKDNMFNADCDHNMTVELSPAYEINYYVPEQEEKEELDPKRPPLPYQYRL
ncbi:uncharacterized protein DDB_G0290587-like [Leptidea sinapis]|uniref:uncharacterized protein DDB_G0290587-like n=1 Tax=Leptidea sinapis TaxID=189913 RepID=UPI0021C3FD74|nr:uncharacterized protein DDB_G0290587-like [Leptidea sinapis]